MQINHPGRQVLASLGEETVSASDVPVEIPGMSKNFNPPRALTEAEIQDLVARFARTAALAEEAGFDGVQIHAAHGYLISQFLSAYSNQRPDGYGGSVENRYRFAHEIIQAVSEAIPKDRILTFRISNWGVEGESGVRPTHG